MTRAGQRERDEERAALRARYGALLDRVSAALFSADPMRINYGTNTDEYELEARRILPRLDACESEEDALTVVHEVHIQCFDAKMAGQRARYAGVAGVIWRLWQARDS